jgi:hypothetical protein
VGKPVVGVGVKVAVITGVDVSVAVGGIVAEGVCVGVRIGVEVGVTVGCAVSVGAWVGVNLGRGEGVAACRKGNFTLQALSNRHIVTDKHTNR